MSSELDVPHSAHNDANLPVFNRDILATLSKKIEKGLGTPSETPAIVQKEKSVKTAKAKKSTRSSPPARAVKYEVTPKGRKRTHQGAIDGRPADVAKLSTKALAVKTAAWESSQHQKSKLPTKDTPQLVIEPRPDWHALELPPVALSSKTTVHPSPRLVERVKQYARSLLESENRTYASDHLASSSQRFLSTIMSSGTLSDRISALTLVVQESPLHTINSFNQLLGLSRKRSRAQALTALGALKDLLGQGVLLPSGRKLRAFAHQPGLLMAFQPVGEGWMPGDALPGQLRETHLIVWAYEDWLKSAYFEMLKILEGWCNDEVEYARGKAISYVWELLKEKPEQESNLLRLLINKLGDPQKRIASKASFLILQLQITYPLMTPVIISSIEADLLFRPGQSLHARYYAITTLNQTILSVREEALATKLLDIYFSLFVALIRQIEVSNDGGTGANAIKTNRKGQVQGGGGHAGRKAMKKASLEEKSSKFAEEMNDKMISAVLTGVNRAIPFSRIDNSSFQQYMDTLFRITHSSNFNTSIQALILIQQLLGSRQVSADRYYRTLYESLLDPRLLNSSKQPIYLNLVFRSLKSDLNVKRVKAFVKRLLQIISLHQPSFVCGVLYLVKELEDRFPSLRTLLEDPERNENDDEEMFQDAAENTKPDLINGRDVSEAKSERAYGYHNALHYDGRKRDPEHSNADKSCLWEMLPFLIHFHPSVVLFASSLVQRGSAPTKPDLSLHTLIHFLDRFVYRNAKPKSSDSRGSSIMQPLVGSDSRDRLLSSRQSSKLRAPVNLETFWSKKSEDVAPDEIFFHQYFNQSGKGKASARNTKYEQSERIKENGEVTDENKIWKALVDSKPELEGSDEGESGTEMEYLESTDEASDSDGTAGSRLDNELDDALNQSDDPDVSGLDDSVEHDENDENIAISDGGEDLPLDVEKAFIRELKVQPGLSQAHPREQSSGRKRRKLKHLPTFASVDDYAEMLAEDDGGQGSP